MSRRKALIVDGYNVIRNNDRYAGLGQDFSDEAWNKAREKLINDTSLYAENYFDRCTVVFDGAGNEYSAGQPVHEAGIDVIFSAAGTSADSVIERLAFDARKQGLEVVVISSDFTLQATVFGGGVTRMSAASFTRLNETLENEWRDSNLTSKQKNTLAERVDPGTLAKLNELLNR